jgi:CheY-like chemotaxis protein
MTNLKTVLVADVEEGLKLIKKLVPDRANINRIDNFTDLQRVPSKDVDLIVCGLSFADSYMFDLLRLVKANPETRDIPFLCFNVGNSVLSNTTLDAVNVACRSLGAVGFINFPDVRMKFGDQEAEKQLQSLLIDLITPGYRRGMH